MPYAKEQGVVPVEVWKEVQYAHNAKDNFSN